MALYICTMSETLCLKWNEFQENIKALFENLRGDVDFADVSLACEDGYQIEAHRVILAASSPFFQNILKRNKHSHPIIFMRGMKPEHLDAIVDFLYFGKANVCQQSLESFLAIAEELKLKGLVGQSENRETDSKHFLKSFKADPKQFKMSEQEIPLNRNLNENLITTDFETYLAQKNEVALPATSELQELSEKVKSMMEKSQSTIKHGAKTRVAFTCKVCGKEGHNTDIKRHIEAAHIEGISIPCNFCDKRCTSRQTLRLHKTTHHKIDFKNGVLQ